MRHLKLVLASAAASVALAAALPAVAQDVKLGMLTGLTGPLEAMSPPMQAGAELAIKQINDQGGILGGPATLIVGDDTCADAAAGSAAADRLINTDGILAIVGPMCSGVTIAVANTVAIPSGVTILSSSATSPALTTMEDNDLVFRAVPSDAYQGEVLARLLFAKGITDVALTYVNNDYGKGFADSFEAAFLGLGGTVPANVAHEEGKSDYRAELGNLAASGSQNLVILAYNSGSGNTVLRQAIESGDFTVYIGGDGMVGDAMLAGLDASALEGFIGTKPGTPAVPGTAIFNDAATAAGVDPTSTFVPQSYDAAFLLGLAVQKNGTATREGLNAALREVASAPGETILPGEWQKAVDLIAAGTDINYEGAAGSYEFDAAGDVAGTIVEMTVKDGTFIEIGPAS